MQAQTRLILGGHSFISQLGNDPMPSDEVAIEIVKKCLDHGITWFDTTYAPERIALGKALHALGRRDEATIIAWNFFKHFGPEDSVSGHEPYTDLSIKNMLTELKTDSIDLLIVHPVDNPIEQISQETLALKWQENGLVRQLGTWMPNLKNVSDIYQYVVAPYNSNTPNAAQDFAAYKAKGWTTIATSPFVRGHELDAQSVNEDKAIVADRMLRYSAFAENVDHLVVSMRRPEWVETNVASWHRGRLN
jgi:aryl-alcohol dehydrogenase-like predicted oxidoreductase